MRNLHGRSVLSADVASPYTPMTLSKHKKTFYGISLSFSLQFFLNGTTDCAKELYVIDNADSEL